MKEPWGVYKPQDTDMAPLVQEPLRTDNEFLLYLDEQAEDIQVIKDEYEHYCNQPTLKLRDARNWWLQPTQQEMYPNLSRLALEILSIPAISAEPERLFSATKLIITDQRNRLSMMMIEALASLKSWYKLKDWIMDRDLFVGPKGKDEDGEEENWPLVFYYVRITWANCQFELPVWPNELVYILKIDGRTSSVHPKHQTN